MYAQNIHLKLRQGRKWQKQIGRVCMQSSDGFNDCFPWFSSCPSVRQEESFRIICSVAFPVEVNHGMLGSQLSQSDSAPPSFSNDRADGHQSTHNITTKFLSAEEHSMFGIRMLLLRPVPLHHDANLTQWTNDRDKKRETETWNQVGSFLLKSRSSEMMRSQTTHH